MLSGPIELIIYSFQLYKKNWRKYMPYMLLLFLASVAVLLVGSSALFIEAVTKIAPAVTAVVVLVVIVASSLFVVWVSIALTKAISNNILMKKEENWKEMMGKSSHLILPLLLASILSAIIIFVGGILFIIPGIIFTGWFAFVSYEIILKEKGVMDAIKGSKAIVSGRWFSIIWRIIVPGLFFAIIILSIDALIGIGISFAIPEKENFISTFLINIFSSFIGAAIGPLTSIFMIKLYWDVLDKTTVIDKNK